MKTLAIWLACGFSSVYADIVYTQWGSKIEGIATREPGWVLIETESGKVRLRTEDVKFIDTDHQAPREIYNEKLAALKNSEAAKDFMDLAVWARQNKVNGVHPYLMEKVAFLCKSEAELKAMLDAAPKNSAHPLVIRALEMLRTSEDISTLLAFADAARGSRAPEAQKILIDRVFELMTRTKEPAEVLSTAGKLQELGFTEELAPFINRAAGLCAGKNVRFIEELLEQLHDLELVGHATKFYRRILDQDPDNEKARRALGYHQHGGRWLTYDEWQVAQGNVKYDGRWMSPKERDFELKEKTFRLEERARELDRKMEEAKRRAEEDRRFVDDSRRRLDEQLRLLEERERRLTERETELSRHSHCSSCNVWYRGNHTCLNRFTFCHHCSSYYTGTHVCSHDYSYCRCCNGYFSRGHSCKR